jgi:hypothetical protein
MHKAAPKLGLNCVLLKLPMELLLIAQWKGGLLSVIWNQRLKAQREEFTLYSSIGLAPYTGFTLMY